VAKLGRQPENTKRELQTLILATAFYYDSGHDGMFESMPLSHRRGAPLSLLHALLWHFCRVPRGKLAGVWFGERGLLAA
jgi:hypothetical protein